jgi:hypothetical protein
VSRCRKQSLRLQEGLQILKSGSRKVRAPYLRSWKQTCILTVVLQADFDPEEDVKYDSGSGSEAESSGDEDAGTEHYEKVGYVHI